MSQQSSLTQSAHSVRQVLTAYTRGMFERPLEDLGFQRLLTEQPLQLAHLALQSPIIRGRHDLFAAAGSRQRPLHHQPPPGEELVRRNAMSASHQAYRHARLEGLLDHPNLLCRCPAPTALNRCDDLNSIREIAPEPAGHGLPLSKCEAYNRVYEQPC